MQGEMFGKSKPPDRGNQLTNRVRQIAERAPERELAAERHRCATKDRAPRQSVFRNGAIVLDSGERLGVAVKDISATGARVEFFQRIVLPETFMLSEPTMKLKRRVRIIWQREGSVGVQFTE